MADNVDITAGSGTTIHSDEYTHTTLGSGKTQLVKLVDGTLDSDTAIGVPDIGVKANAIRVCPASDVTDATYIGDIKFGEPLPAGTNGIGKLTANSGVDIGDVDVTSCDGIAAEAAALGNGILIQGDDGTDRKNINVDATTGDVQVDVTNTVTVDCNSSDVTIDNAAGASAVNIQDGGNSITVDGTVTETNSAAILADTANMDTNIGTIAGDTTSIDGKITACNTGAVVLAASDGTDIGDVDVATLPATAAEAAALPSVFVVVAGDDGTDTHPLQLDASGHLQVDIAADSVGVGGGTQYTEDVAAAADPVGNATILVRDDTPGALVSTDGDNVAQRGTNYGAAFCQILDSSGNFIDTFGGSGGTAEADDADFVAGTTQGTPAMGVYESSPTSVTDGDLGTVGITSTRSLKVEETNSTAILADTANMDTNLGTIAGDTTSIDGKITACNTGAVVLAAGSATFGKLAANSGVDIGDVDVTSMPANVTASGTITAAAQTVSVTPPNGCSAASLQVTGSWAGQIEFEGTVDGTNYQSVEASNGAQTVNATTTNDIFLLPGAGYLTLRVRSSSWTNGTANINFIATIGTTSSILTGSIPSGTNAIGKLAANSGVDIGDVDVTSCDGIAAEAAALGNGILIQGDDGTDRKNINVDATTGDVQVDVTNTITETNSATIAGDTTSIDGKITACNTGAVVISSGSVTETNSAAILADTASMDTNLGTVAGAVVAGQMQVDIVADGAGLATAANQSTVIGHLDGVEGSLTDIETNTDFGAVTGGGEEASALRVTLASDSTGTLTVDTTGTTGLEVVQTTAADLNCTEASASGILTAVQIMDDWDAVHDSAASSDGPQLIAAYDSTKPTAVADGDAVRVLSDSYGRLLAGLEPEWFNATYDSSDATAEGATVKAATASKKIYILSCILSSDVEGWIKLQDEDSNALTGKMWLKAGGGMSLTWPPEAPLVLNTVNKALEVIAEAAGDVSVTVTGYLAP